ncbi:MAG: NAD(+)/NADH kinase [Clostridia bacterium]|nr:NAD(+)/NADH kinase [Clostridia bacterium]
MKKAIIIPNPYKQQSVDFALEASVFLKENGYETQILDNDEATPWDDAEFAVVMGGDGTVLRAARRLYGKNITLFGINFGNLGYLTEVGPQNAIDGLSKLVSKDYKTEKRIMIEGEIIRDGKAVFEFVGLNEACIFRSSLTHALSMQVYINGKLTENIVGDGVIVATPTGSTSYNFSASGPVLSPTSASMVITPVSPKYFPRSSIVIDGTENIEIKISWSRVSENGRASIDVDGHMRYSLENGDTVRIKKAQHHTLIAKVSDTSFYQILCHKLSKASPDINE